jgi:hypothetical protein
MVKNPWWFESVEILKTRNRWLLFLGSLKKKSELKKTSGSSYIFPKLKEPVVFMKKTRRKPQVSGWWSFHYFVIF